MGLIDSKKQTKKKYIASPALSFNRGKSLPVTVSELGCQSKSKCFRDLSVCTDAQQSHMGESVAEKDPADQNVS